MRVLVTGGAGFLGSHLCKRLLQENHEVLCLDNLFTGSKQNVSELQLDSNFEFIRHDIVEPIKLEVDQIYHLACPASPKDYQYNSIKTIKTCILGTLNCLGIAKRTKSRILQASTSEVYGNPLVHPQNESYFGNVNPIGIRACYDEGKRCAETLCFDYHRQNKLDIRVVRIFNTYGPNMSIDDGRVVSNFIVQALEGKPITIYGKGDQTRSFCYVDDLIDGIIAFMNQDESIGPMNLGNPEEYTILELAEEILSQTNSSSEIIFEKLPQDDPIFRRPDVSLAERLINWQPKTSLKTGIEKTIAYFERVLRKSL